MLRKRIAPPEAPAGTTRLRSAAAFAAAVLVVTAAACGDDADGAIADDTPDGTESEAGPESLADGSPTSSPPDIATGGIEIDAPEGWQEIPLPALGFGVAIPDGWEAVVMSDEGLASLRHASPAVPDFVASAVAAARSGAVFYAAGVEDPAGADAGDGQTASGATARGTARGSAQVVDLKVRADTASGARDANDLEDYARQAAGRLPGARVERVAEAPLPIIDISYRASAGRVIDGDDLDEHEADDGADGGAAAGGSTDARTSDARTGDARTGGDQTSDARTSGDQTSDARTSDDITVEGTERLVLATSGIVYSFIVTSEDAASHDELAPLLLDTVAFPPDRG